MTPPFTTLTGLLLHVGQTYRNPTALVYRQNDVWISLSTAEVKETVQKIGTGLLELGLKPGDRLGIMADPSPFWIMLDMAALGCGAITVPLFPNVAPENLGYEIRDSGMRFLFLSSEAQLSVARSSSEPLECIIALPKALELHGCISWEMLEIIGAKRLQTHPDQWEKSARDVKEEDTATLIYTSGSTGIPKGVELTHKNLISQVRGTAARFPLDPEKDRILSCLPLAHVLERIGAYYYLSSGTSLYFAEDIKKVGDYLHEIHPTVIILVPRLLDKMFAKIQSNVEATTGFKKLLAHAAFKRAREKSPTAPSTSRDKVFEALVYRKMRTALGGSLRLVISGGAPLDPNLYGFFLNIGLPVYEGYGLTEASPVVAANFPGHRKVGTVGVAYPGVEVRIAPDGEILAHGAGIMKGYYRKPEETASTIDVDGWLHTGDLGDLDAEGYLRITGRKKELFKTAGGKYVAPVPIEQAIGAHKFVDMVLVVAEGRPFTTALLFPNLDGLKAWKQELGHEAMDDLSFLRSKEATVHLQQVVEAVNAKLNHWEKIQKFHLAEEALSISAGELTPTLKIRRHIVEEKFRRQIESFYKS
jgi:long-chain acyl-CoA synthetase